MNKLKAAVLYEYATKIKAMGVFYLIQYAITALIFAIVLIFTDGSQTGSNALEISFGRFCKRDRGIGLQGRL